MDDHSTLFIKTSESYVEVEISFNTPKPDMNGKDPIYLAVKSDDRSESCGLSVAQARELRDHLNFLLGETPEPGTTVVNNNVVSDDAVTAMKELAHYLSLVDYDTIGDLTDALKNFNK